jgi:hypothetical protein
VGWVWLDKKIAPPITTAQVRNEAATISLRGALMPKPSP